MKKEKLFDALDGLFAYDQGAIDSGIHDDGLKREVMEYLGGLNSEECDSLITEFLHQTYRPDTGYTYRDWIDFVEWLEEML